MPIQRKRRPRVLMMACIVAGIGCCDVLATAKAARTPQGISYCQAVGAPRKYDQHYIRVSGILTQGAESSTLYAAQCRTRSQVAWVGPSPTLAVLSSPELRAALDHLLEEDARAEVVAIVKFEAPRKVSVPPGTPPKVADVMRQVNSRYGHMNQYNYRITLIKVEKVGRVDHKQPWPK